MTANDLALVERFIRERSEATAKPRQFTSHPCMGRKPGLNPSIFDGQHYAEAFRLPEHSKIEEILNPATDAAGRTGIWITAKYGHKIFFVFHVQQGNAATILISLLAAQDLSGTGSAAFPANVPIWANQDTSTATGTDTLVAQTAGTTFTTSAATKNKIVVFECDPAYLNDTGPSTPFKTVTISTGASNAGNLTQCIAYVIGMRYAQATPPTMNSGTP